MADRKDRTFRCNPAIAWVKDEAQTLLVDEEHGCCWSLRGVQAVIWDLLALGYPIERQIEFLALLEDGPGAEAEKTLATTVQAWHQAGILQPAEEA